ncbi:MAG: PorT family protein [Dysgonamonadaceae bacterium]|jgi:hypothetical protein|nr:PorT family protein [Dysgonamonadaceae bacterium]
MVKYLKYSIMLICGLIYCCSIQAQRELSPLTSKVVNWGVRVGINALDFIEVGAIQHDVELGNVSYTNKVGFTGGAFFRVNLSNFFMQPEVAYNYTQEKFSFGRLTEAGTSSLQTDVNVHYRTLSIPVVAGCNIVKQDHYLLSVYLGPDFRYSYRTSFDLESAHFVDKSPQYNINALIGFSLNVSHLFFDFRYEINRPDTDIHFADVANAPEFIKDISVKKNENILSFSCGFMF